MGIQDWKKQVPKGLFSATLGTPWFEKDTLVEMSLWAGFRRGSRARHLLGRQAFQTA
jgi:hypothetical protein